MVERRASLRESLKFAKEAVGFAMDQREKAAYRDDMPLFPREKAAYFFSLLKPAELKKWVNILSSYKYGQWVFDLVFPKYNNPEDYHSTEAYVCLDEEPVQVLGWQEEEELIQEGVKQGLQKDWIDAGFVLRSEERGIDLEWHFAEFVPETKENNFPFAKQETRQLASQ